MKAFWTFLHQLGSLFNAQTFIDKSICLWNNKKIVKRFDILNLVFVFFYFKIHK